MSAFYSAHLLQGRRFLITGATGGAGSATARAISRVGGICTLVARDGDKGERVLKTLMGQGHVLKFLPGELGEGAGFDGWFHAAGEAQIFPLKEAGGHSLEAGFTIAAGLLSSVGLRSRPLIKDGGSIVFMSSVAAVRGQTGMSLYCASKGAVEALARAAAVELAPRRIRVNCIRAGAFDSPMHRRICQRATPDAIDEYARRHLFGFGKTKDIANAALFLLCDASRWITGTALTCDGGYSAK